MVTFPETRTTGHGLETALQELRGIGCARGPRGKQALLDFPAKLKVAQNRPCHVDVGQTSQTILQFGQRRHIRSHRIVRLQSGKNSAA